MICRSCKEDLPTEAFGTVLGRRVTACLACESKRVAALQQRKASLDANYKKERRAAVKLSQEKNKVYTVALNKATKLATKRLKELYRLEYEQLLDEARAELGLPQSNRRPK
jgi:hypothetical protein